MARKSGFVRRNGVMRREMVWLDTIVASVTLASPSAVALVTTLNAAALAARPFTVVRSRGFLQVKSDQIAAQETFQVGYGQIVVTDIASAAGVASVPTPEVEVASDWQTYQWAAGALGFVTGAGIWNDGIFVEFDSKAMRKVDQGDDLIEVVEASSVSLGATVKIFNRTLIKLH